MLYQQLFFASQNINCFLINDQSDFYFSSKEMNKQQNFIRWMYNNWQLGQCIEATPWENYSLTSLKYVKTKLIVYCCINASEVNYINSIKLEYHVIWQVSV